MEVNVAMIVPLLVARRTRSSRFDVRPMCKKIVNWCRRARLTPRKEKHENSLFSVQPWAIKLRKSFAILLAPADCCRFFVPRASRPFTENDGTQFQYKHETRLSIQNRFVALKWWNGKPTENGALGWMKVVNWCLVSRRQRYYIGAHTHQFKFEGVSMNGMSSKMQNPSEAEK